jgi:hypothetical protein
MPSLNWLLNSLPEAESPHFRHRLTDATTVFGALTLWLILRQYVPARGHPPTSLTDKLLGMVTAGMLVANIVFFILGDRYTIVYVPFVLWVIGRTASPWGNATRAVVLVGCIYALRWSTDWTYRRLEPATTYFALADRALERGAAPRDVDIGWQWQGYHGAFDEWVESVRHREGADLNEFFPWLDARGASSRYVIVDDEVDGDTVIVAKRPWRDVDGAMHTSYLVDRRP